MNEVRHGFRNALWCALCVTLAFPRSAASQSSSGAAKETRAQVMLLGVYHFDNPNLDYVKSEFDDHRSPKRQTQIAEVVAALAKFNPTKIVIEAPPEAAVVEQRYEAYRKGAYELGANESEQLGFRLAKQLGHERIYLGDHPMDMDLGAVMSAAQATDNHAFLDTFQGAILEAQEMQKRHGQSTVREALLELNAPKHNDRTRALYLQMARVRSADRYVGAEVLADWYKRNFCIFTNILALIESPNDRVLVIFGQGHCAYLRDWVASYPELQLVEPNEYLARK